MSTFGAPALSIDRSKVFIGYAPESQVKLGEPDEKRLADTFTSNSISVQFIGQSDKPVVGTWYPEQKSKQTEPLDLLLVMTGSVIQKAFLQRFLRDLYTFFSDHIRCILANPAPLNAVHYGILIDLQRADGCRYYAAMSFRTEEDLVVNLYCLYQHLAVTPFPPVTEQPMEFTCPEPSILYNAISVVLKIYGSGMLGFVTGWLVYKRLLVSLPYAIVAGIASVVLGAMVTIAFGVAVHSFGVRYLRIREQRWRRLFKTDAERWIKDLRD